MQKLIFEIWDWFENGRGWYEWFFSLEFERYKTIKIQKFYCTQFRLENFIFFSPIRFIFPLTKKKRKIVKNVTKCGNEYYVDKYQRFNVYICNKMFENFLFFLPFRCVVKHKTNHLYTDTENTNICDNEEKLNSFSEYQMYMQRVSTYETFSQTK